MFIPIFLYVATWELYYGNGMIYTALVALGNPYFEHYK